MIRLIAAVAEGGVIGDKGKIPWDMPDDRRLFKELTMGSVLVMGRVTYESIGRPLPGRETIVVTTHPEKIKGDVKTASDLPRALAMAGEKEIFISGGQSVYKEGLKYAQIMYITKVELAVNGDAFFPEEYEEGFRLIGRNRICAAGTLFTYIKGVREC